MAARFGTSAPQTEPAREFFKGDQYFHWGMYLQYAQLFPNDVNFTIGVSDYHKDWYFEQVPHAVNDKGDGRSVGRSTTWTIRFNLPRRSAAGRF